jgi:fucose 4-O-acetylase-like acetyltransferase
VELPTPNASARDRSIDAIKGALICLVILGHIPTLQHQQPLIVATFYTFHVASFLLLTFLYPPPLFTAAALRDRVVRYVTPFLIFYTLYALAYVVLFRPYLTIPIALRDYAEGLLIASSRTLEVSAGLKMLWFLPALIMLAITRSFLARQPQTIQLLAVLIFAHGCVGDFGMWRYLLPWGLPVVLFIYPLGLLIKPALAWVSERSRALSMLSLCLALHTVAVLIPFKVDLGDLHLYGFSHPHLLLLQDLLIITTTLTLLCFGHLLAKIPGLVLCGRFSLPAYLIHPAITQLVIRAPYLKTCPSPLQAIIVLALTIASAAAAAVIAAKLPRLYHAIFPRRTSDLRLIG